MLKQQAIMKIPKYLQHPFWKRLMLVTALFLSTGPLALMVSTQTAYASPSHYTHSPHTVRNNVLRANGGKFHFEEINSVALVKITKFHSMVKNNVLHSKITKFHSAGKNSLPGATPTNSLPGAPLITIYFIVYNVCYAGQGGSGGVSYASSTGGGGGPGGDCVLYSNKGETGGSSGAGSSGGNLSIGR